MKFEGNAAYQLPAEEPSLPKKRKRMVPVTDLAPEDLVPETQVKPSARRARILREHETIPADMVHPDEDDFEELSADDLHEEKPEDITDEAIAELEDEEVVDVNPADQRKRNIKTGLAELSALDEKKTAEDAARRLRAEEGVQFLAAKDRRQGVPEYGKAETRHMAEERLSKTDAASDGLKELAKADRKRSPKTEARRDAEARLETIRKQKEASIAKHDLNIALAKAGTEFAKSEKARIELDSALELGRIHAEGDRRKAEREHETFEASSEGRGRARDRGMREGAEREEQREAGYDRELEIDKDGYVVGLKDVPSVSLGAFYRGMAPEMRAITAETNWAREQLHGGARERRLKQLAEKAAKWERMFEKAQAIESKGAHQDEASIRNEFFSVFEETESGLEKGQVENAIAMSPERFESEMNAFAEAEKKLDIAIQKIEAGYQHIQDNWKKADAIAESFDTSLARGSELNEALQAMKENVKVKLAGVQEMKQTSRADVLAIHLESRISHARSMQESIRQFLQQHPEAASKLTERIDFYETRESDAQEKLAQWKQDSDREAAMKDREEVLERREKELSDELAEINQTIEENMKTGRVELAKAQAVRAQYKEQTGGQEKLAKLIADMNDWERYLNRGRTLVQEERGALLEAWTAAHGYEVDTGDLDAVDVDLSDLEGSKQSTASQPMQKAA